MEGPAEELTNYRPDHGRPRAAAAGPRSEHRYALQDKNGRDWLSFKVQSRAADPKHMPLFLQGDIIKGEVHLDLAKGESLKGITVTVRRRHLIYLSSRTSRCYSDSRRDNGRGTGGGTLSEQNRADLDPGVAKRIQGRRRAYTRVLHLHPTRCNGSPGPQSDAKTFCTATAVISVSSIPPMASITMA